jgi:uncharacterized protein
MNFFCVNEAKGVVELAIKASPASSKNIIVGVEEGRLKIKLKSAPVDGEANKELVAFLSKSLKVPKSDIVIKSGQTSKMKKLEIPLSDELLEKLREIK